MNLKILKKTSNELRLEFEGEGHSLLNVLQKTLLEDSDVEVAGYNVPHPLITKSTLYIRTSKKKPQTALLKAIKDVQAEIKEFNIEFKKGLKKQRSDNT